MTSKEEIASIVKLIKLMENEPLIHDPRKVDELILFESWMKIAKALGVKVAEAKKKWKDLCFIYTNIRNITDPELDNVYPYFLKRQMSFMNSILKPIPTRKIVDISAIEETSKPSSANANVAYSHKKRTPAMKWCDEIDTECRKQFLLSLITDMRRMTPVELFKFKATLVLSVEETLKTFK